MDTDITVSVSKGVFIFANGLKKIRKRSQKPASWFDLIFTRQPWYVAYKRNCNLLENKIKQMHHETYSMLLNDIVDYINSFHQMNRIVTLDGVIPTATLLTGINQPDHVSQFTALNNLIRENATPHIAIIKSQDGSSIKLMVENVVWQLINGQNIVLDNSEDEYFDNNIEFNKPILKKNQCTMKNLEKWYNGKYCSLSKPEDSENKILVIVISDFESFHCNILQDFVMILSSYISKLPFVLVFGVATSVSTLHKSFPYNVSSKLLIKVFHSHSSPVYMNQVLERIFLTPTSNFHLSGKAFELLTDVFLFYDFSVAGLIQSIKYCMMNHYYGDNIKSLCCELEEIDGSVKDLTSDDLENVRQLFSFRQYVEKQDCETKIKLFEDDNFFRKILCKEMHKLRDYLFSFYACVRLLYVFVKDLPKNVLGKSIREIYSKCATENMTSTTAFRECMQLLDFQSQIKLIDNINDALDIVNVSLQTLSPVKPLRSPMKNNLDNISFSNDFGVPFMKSVRVHLITFMRQIQNSKTKHSIITNLNDDEETDMDLGGNRYKLKEKLLRATKADKIQSEFEMIRSRFLSYLEEVFTKGLKPPHTQTFHEIIFFSDVSNIKRQIVGSPRGAIHTALSNPVHYLQCKCCVLPTTESAVDTLPDMCLAYKLHKECGKHINLYDWLQAFAAVLIPDEDGEQRHQDASIQPWTPWSACSASDELCTSQKTDQRYYHERICCSLLFASGNKCCGGGDVNWQQARFTRAVAELQFLGFIKSSKKKTDHVMRLTW